MPKQSKAKRLTPQQIGFLDDLYQSPDEAQHVVYSRHYAATGKVARANCSRLLKREEAQLYLAAKQEATAQRNAITEDDIVQKLWNLANYDICEIINEHGDMKPLHEIPEEHRYAITGVSPVQGGMLKLTLANRESCLVRVAEMLGFGAKNKAENSEASMLADLFRFVQKNGNTGKPGALKFDMAIAARSQFDTE